MEPAAPPIGSPFDLRVSVSEKVDETKYGLQWKAERRA